jgi:hypothetical protein
LDVNFLAGEIRASVSFRAVSHEPPSSWEILGFYTPAGEIITAGLGSPFAGGALYSICRWDGIRWECLASSGIRETLKPETLYRVTVRKLPRAFELFVDGTKRGRAGSDAPWRRVGPTAIVKREGREVPLIFRGCSQSVHLVRLPR